MARLAAERGQEEDGFLSIDEFETIHGWHGRPAASRPEPEPEREPEPAAGGGGPDAEDAFDTRDYWEKFNADPGCYEWYGGDGLQESIVQSVVQCARLVRPDRPTAARVLDVGTGTSPILFLLTERERFTAVEGTDWSARACDFMSAQAEQRGLRECLRYRQADGRRLDAVYDEGSWDVVLDKVRCTTTRPAPLRPCAPARARIVSPSLGGGCRGAGLPGLLRVRARPRRHRRVLGAAASAAGSARREVVAGPRQWCPHPHATGNRLDRSRSAHDPEIRRPDKQQPRLGGRGGADRAAQISRLRCSAGGGHSCVRGCCVGRALCPARRLRGRGRGR